MRRVSQEGPMAVVPSYCFFIVLLQLLAAVPFHVLAKSPQFSPEIIRLPTDAIPLPVAHIPGDDILRSDFPEGFVFGTATSAYQVEGAVHEGGRGTSIWDTFSHNGNNIMDGTNGDIAVDQYHRYEEDFDLLVDMNMKAYRFSIAWTRIFPDGKGTEPNQQGLDYYNRLIDALVRRGITPYVTLYHWDLPQALQDAYSGWLCPQIVDAYAAYAEACFAAFGDRVKNWITFNEPMEFVQGYGQNPKYPPGPYVFAGSSPYTAAHHVLLAHANAVSIYRQKYQAKQGGIIGITVDCSWSEPITSSIEDREASNRDIQFQLGWWLDPIVFGDYPAIMKTNIGHRLPKFTDEEKALLKGSADFLGLNHYTSRWVVHPTWQCPPANSAADSNIYMDRCTETTPWKGDVAIGPVGASDWLYVVPWGIHRLIMWVNERYNKPIFITENGYDYDSAMPLEEALNDTIRIQYYKDYMSYVLQAIRDGANVQGYFAWSLLDNFEWADGNNYRFGLVYVDYADNLKRYPKDSAHWFSRFLSS